MDNLSERLFVPVLVTVAMVAIGGCVTKRIEQNEGRATRKVAILPAEQPAAATAPAGYGFIDGRLLVTFKGEAAATAAELARGGRGPVRFGDPTLDRLCNKYRASGLQPASKQDSTPGYILFLAPDANVLRAAKEFGASPLVERAEPVYRLQLGR